MGNLAIPLTRPLTVPLTTVPAGLRLGGGAVAAVGAAALLEGEANGFAADFTWATDAKRVAVKASSVVTEYAVDAFFANAGTSPKQVYDVAGTLGWSPHNMCLRSQEFNQATPWNPTTAVTVTANAIAAPDGTLTADQLVETAGTNGHQILHATITVIIGATYTVAARLKYGGRQWAALQPLNETASNFFDLQNGVLGATADACTITALDDGWYLCTITRVAVGVAWAPTIYNRLSNGQTATYAGDITKGVYAWGAQLNRGSVPTAYLPTTTAARYGLALDYDPVTHAARGLLCEPAATNLLLNNATLSTQSVTVTAAAHTLSFWGIGTITLSGVSTAGPLVGTGANDRVSLTFTPTAGSLTCTVSGTVSRAQLETGSVATSPIPTYAASATRAVNQYNCTAASVNYSTTAGSWWVEQYHNSSAAGSRVIGYVNYSPIYHDGSGSFALTDGTVLSKAVTGLFGNIHRTATAFASGSRGLTANGLAAATDAGSVVNLLAATTLYLGANSPGTNPMFGYIRKVYYVPRRMSNAELVTETT